METQCRISVQHTLKIMILLIFLFSVIETIEGLIRHILRYTEYNQ